MKKIFLIINIVLLGVFSGCEKFVGGDINIDPNRSSNVTLNGLLPAAIEATADNHFRLAYTTSMLAQQTAAYSSGDINSDRYINVRVSAQSAFERIYQTALTNINLMVKLADQQNAPYYAGIGRVLEAINLGLATDTWGDVPFSQAFKGAEVLYPQYDSQEAIYIQIQSLLDQAIANLQQPAGDLKPGSDDLIYNGTAASWIKTAYVLKARFELHAAKRKGAVAYDNILTWLANGYTGNTNDCQLVYNEKNLNPWYVGVAAGIATGNFRLTHSKKLIESMNGTLYPTVDPRLPIIADKGTNATYAGIENGNGSGSTVNISPNTYYAKTTAPILMVTYAEMKFIQAEAEFLKNGGTRTSIGTTAAGYTAYQDGIKANMDKLGVTAAQRDTYLADVNVGVGQAGLKLEHILKEKHIALFLNPEAWVDVRRYDYDANLYKGMGLPDQVNPDLNGQFIRRALYPTSEITRNPNAVAAEKELTTKVWWNE